MQKAAQMMMDLGAKSVVIEGGRLTGEGQPGPLTKAMTFVSPRIDTKNARRSVSSAIAADLANGMARAEAVKTAKRYSGRNRACAAHRARARTDTPLSKKGGFEGMTR